MQKNADFKLEMTVQELVEDTRAGKPHVVILGAGASKAAFPQGDKDGNKLPLMCDMAKILQLDAVLKTYNINCQEENFEEIYSNLCGDPAYQDALEAINGLIWDYFSKLKPPPYPTIYDHLVLSLREKDLIATFNWDPFLYLACWRNHNKVKLPNIAYLHGNVAVGYCLKDNARGWIGSNCNKCGNSFTPSKLLYPIKQKDYDQYSYIKHDWETLRTYLKHAYILTVYGYSAPTSDVVAIDLMKDAWGKPHSRNLEQTGFILEPRSSLSRIWKEDFAFSGHYDIFHDFYESDIALFPRRTCEAQWNSVMECRLLEQNPIPKGLGFSELWDWYSPLIDAEKKH